MFYLKLFMWNTVTSSTVLSYVPYNTGLVSSLRHVICVHTLVYLQAHNQAGVAYN